MLKQLTVEYCKMHNIVCTCLLGCRVNEKNNSNGPESWEMQYSQTELLDSF